MNGYKDSALWEGLYGRTGAEGDHEEAVEMKYYELLFSLEEGGGRGRMVGKVVFAFISHCSHLLAVANKLYFSPYIDSALPMTVTWG